MIRSGKDKRFMVFVHFILILASLLAVVPFVMLILGSFADNGMIVKEGYSFIPHKFSLEAYQYMGYMSDTFIRAYAITIITTVIGTALSLMLTSSLGYGLSRSAAPGMKVFSFLVLFTMLFRGGLVPTYMIYTRVFNVKNSLAAYIFPNLLISGFNVMLVKSYVRTNVPQALLESAELDGASEMTIFFRIVMPLSLPILATIGLLVGVTYWNSWQNGLYYITDTQLYSIQNILNRMLQDIRYLQSGAMGSYAGELMSNMPTNSVRMAIAVIGVLPILVLYPFFQKYFVKGITVGAVKG